MLGLNGVSHNWILPSARRRTSPRFSALVKFDEVVQVALLRSPPSSDERMSFFRRLKRLQDGPEIQALLQKYDRGIRLTRPDVLKINLLRSQQFEQWADRLDSLFCHNLPVNLLNRLAFIKRQFNEAYPRTKDYALFHMTRRALEAEQDRYRSPSWLKNGVLRWWDTYRENAWRIQIHHPLVSIDESGYPKR